MVSLAKVQVEPPASISSTVRDAVLARSRRRAAQARTASRAEPLSSPAWALPVNLFVWPAALRSVSSLAGLRQPWQRLAGLLGKPELRQAIAGGAYLARWRVPGHHS